MKKLLITAALVTAIASPAFAQKVKHPRSVDQYAQTAQTKQSARTETRRNSSNDVFDSAGHYLSSDPDPRVRMDILRDHGYDD